MSKIFPSASAAALALASAAAAQPGAGEANAKLREFRAANVPLVAQPLDLSQKSDPIWVKGERPAGNVIARLALKPVEAIVVTDDVGQGPGQPILAALALTGEAAFYIRAADLHGFRTQRLYCGATPAGTFKILCLEDRDGDGRLDHGMPGVAEAGVGVEQLSLVGKAEPLPRPVAYRPARPDEVKPVTVAYRNCARDHDRPAFTVGTEAAAPSPQVMAMMARLNPVQRAQVEALMARTASPCTPGEPVPAGSADYLGSAAPGAVLARLGELVIEVGPKKAGAPVRLLGLRTPDRLYRLDRGALVELAAHVTPKQNSLAVFKKFDRPVLMISGPVEVAEGVRGAGDAVLTASVEHGYMGELTQETTIRTLFSTRSLPKGTMLYGIPMSTRVVTTRNGVPVGGFGAAQQPNADDLNLAWCVPVEEQGEWTATCLPTNGASYTLLKGQRPAFEVRRLSYAATTTTNPGRAPVVEKRGSFGRPLQHRFTIQAVTPTRITVTQDTLYGGVAVNRNTHQLARIAGKPSALLFGGGTLTFADAGAGKVLVKRHDAFESGADAMQAQSGFLAADMLGPAAIARR
jgi:hypothetical protein